MPAKKGTKPWNAGTSQGWTDKRGYRWIYIQENGKRRAIREHRFIMEQHLGRKLNPEELVHHINGDKTDNRVENLSIEDWSQHTVEHSLGSKRDDLTKRRMSILANYREDNRRLKEINSELLEALEEARCDLELAHMKEEDDDVRIELGKTIIKVRAAISKARGV